MGWGWGCREEGGRLLPRPKPLPYIFVSLFTVPIHSQKAGSGES